MDIAFDPAKRQANIEKHGLDFADAGAVFEGATYTMLDDRFDYGEDRFITAGLLNGRCVVLVWTPREGARRMISMRKANEREQALFLGRL